MITVNVDELFVTWLQARLPDVTVASERPAKIEDRLPFVQIRRGASGSATRNLDRPVIYTDHFAADRSAAADLGRRVQSLFQEQTPAAWMGAQFSWLLCNQNNTKVTEPNPALHHTASTTTFSLQ